MNRISPGGVSIYVSQQITKKTSTYDHIDKNMSMMKAKAVVSCAMMCKTFKPVINL